LPPFSNISSHDFLSIAPKFNFVNTFLPKIKISKILPDPVGIGVLGGKFPQIKDLSPPIMLFLLTYKSQKKLEQNLARGRALTQAFSLLTYTSE
jgi:hypothetical protein